MSTPLCPFKELYTLSDQVSSFLFFFFLLLYFGFSSFHSFSHSTHTFTLVFLYSFSPFFTKLTLSHFNFQTHTTTTMVAAEKVVFPTEGKHLLEITREGPLFIMTMVDKENRFTPEMCKAICDALDHVAEVVDKEELTEAALMTRGQDKFYSNGLDMEKAFSVPGFTDHTFMPMLNKILLFGIPTIACLNGYVPLSITTDLLEWEEGSERRESIFRVITTIICSMLRGIYFCFLFFLPRVCACVCPREGVNHQCGVQGCFFYSSLAFLSALQLKAVLVLYVFLVLSAILSFSSIPAQSLSSLSL